MTSRRIVRGVLWGLIALLLVGHLGGGWYYSSQIIEDGFTPDPSPVIIPVGDFDLEEVTYDSALGTFDAWLLPAERSTWIIYVHDLNQSPDDPESLFAPLQQAGYPQLSITYRNDDNQPVDPSGYFMYGATEWEEVRGAVEYAMQNGAEQVVLAGYGVGASHVLSFVYKNRFDAVKGLVLDSADIDFGSTVEYRASLQPLPLIPANIPRTVAWVAEFFTSLRIDVSWSSLDYVDKAERSLQIPVLAFHGTDDLSSPIEESVRLAEAKPDLVRLVRGEGAGHLGSYDADPDGYVSTLLDFLGQFS